MTARRRVCRAAGPRMGLVLRHGPALPGLIALVFTLSGVLAPWITPHDPLQTDLRSRLTPPVFFSWERMQAGEPVIVRGTWSHPMGTDHVGRDLLSRVVYGARTSLLVAVLTLAVGGLVGAGLGLLSGYLGGGVDRLLMRTVDGFLAFPFILLAMLLAVVRGPGVANVVIVIAVLLWARLARVVRAEALALRGRDFVLQATVNGCRAMRIMLVHVLPNIVPTLIVMLTLQVGWVILAEASLSFLGAGIPPPTPTWGTMVADGKEYATSAWWVPAMPALAVGLVVLGFNLLGDWVRDALDPRVRHM